MFCIHCGEKNEEGNKFCIKCGKPLESSGGPSNAAAQPAQSSQPAQAASVAQNQQAAPQQVQAAPAAPQAQPQPVAQPQPQQNAAGQWPIYPKGCAGQAWADIRATKNWAPRTMLLALLAMIPIVRWFVTGFMYTSAKQAAQCGGYGPTPKEIFKGQNFKNGFFVTVISLIGVIAFLIVFIGLTALFFAIGLIPIAVLLIFFDIIIAFLFGMYLSLMNVRATMISFGAGFSLGKVMKAWKTKFGSLLFITIIPNFLCGLIASPITLIGAIVFGASVATSGWNVFASGFSAASINAFFASIAGAGFVGLILSFLSSCVYMVGSQITVRALGHYVNRYASDWIQESVLMDAAKGVPSYNNVPVGATAPNAAQNVAGAASAGQPAANAAPAGQPAANSGASAGQPASNAAPAGQPAANAAPAGKPTANAATPVGNAAAPAASPSPSTPAPAQASAASNAATPKPAQTESAASSSPSSSPSKDSSADGDDTGTKILAGPIMKLVGLKGKEYNIDELPAVVGKGSSADCIVKGDTTISREHIKIHAYKDGQYVIEDLNSTNKTYLNGDILAPGELVVLKDGDTIKIGKKTLKVVVC